MLVIVAILVIIAAFILRRDLIDCEINESPYCPVFVCPPNEQGVILPAQRGGNDGKIQYSG